MLIACPFAVNSQWPLQGRDKEGQIQLIEKGGFGGADFLRRGAKGNEKNGIYSCK